MKREKVTNISLVILVLCYIGLSIMISKYSSSPKLYNAAISFAGLELKVSNIIGCLNVFQLLICVALTSIDWKKGKIIAYCALATSTIAVLIAVFAKGNKESFPGILIDISGFIFVAVLSSRLKIIETNNQFYQKISITDSLTGLKNRRGLRAYTASLIEKDEPFYLMFLDVDAFKYINDTMGHNVGDIILQTVAKRCESIDSHGGIVARNGGDEFIIVVPERKNINIERLGKEYLDAIGNDIWVEEYNMHYYISACIGISHFPSQALDLDSIINNADTAMYEGKKLGKNKIVVFSPEMAEDNIRNKELEDKLRIAMDTEMLYLEYQPQFGVNSHELRGFEALARLKDSEGEIINPGEFIPVAERTDLILDVDMYVLYHVMIQFKEVVENLKNKFTISVNISAKHISEKNFVDDVKNMLTKTGYPAKCLEIEITEYCMIRDFDAATKTLQELNAMGVKIALDDFGTGYASLSNLNKLPIDMLKIDKSFIDNLNTTESNNDFVEAIISMGHMIHCDIISEGVENIEQLDRLRKMNCDYVQGFIWGRPLSYKESCSLIEMQCE